MAKETNISNEIRGLRFHAGEMTQAELAKRVGVSRQTIIAIEQGRYSPSLEVAFQIALVFKVPIEEVFQYSLPANH
ncbi:helix-turn-helix transcriptional regulator [Kordiimonas pumila]|uniref:Helix-turn-helix transcriptional regulator n=1 Tax=Kordiimonas pumila TaxID=2161677 RepID=A0ABV7D979_9PROT|nr:helix-turn-helix transcriptional regulator [Kordiimonas pumila]